MKLFEQTLKGWDIPRMRENMKAEGWSINVEYFSEIMHVLRNDIRYRAVVDDILSIPKGADTRDTEAIKRLCTGFLKLLFPHVLSVNAADKGQFEKYCLKPALHMRSIIRKQLHIIDAEYSNNVPEIKCVN